MPISPSDLHLDQWLGDYFIAWGNDIANAYIGRRVLANIRSNRQAGKIMMGGKEHMRIWDLERTAGEEAARLKRELGTPITFEAHPLEAKDFVTKEMREVAESEGTPYRPYMHTTADLREALEVRLEVKIASLLRGFADDSLTTQNLAGTYNANHYATPTIKWDAANATPFAELRTAKNQVFTQSGHVANTIIIPQTVAETLVETAEYRARLSTNRDILTLGTVLPELRGMNVVIPRSIYYSAANTQVEIWGDDVWLGYVDPNPTPERTFAFAGLVQYVGPQATMNKVTVEELTPTDRQTDQVWACLGEFDVVYLAKEAGYLIYNTLT